MKTLTILSLTFIIICTASAQFVDTDYNLSNSDDFNIKSTLTKSITKLNEVTESINQPLWLWDTLISYNKENLPEKRIYRQFNSSGQIVYLRCERMDTKWKKDYEVNCLYDSKGNRLKMQIDFKDSLETDFEYLFVYNNHNLLISTQLNDYNLIYETKTIYLDSIFYDSNLRKISTITYIENVNNNIYPEKNELIQYDSNGCVKEKLYQFFRNNNWINISKLEIINDLNNNPISMIWYNNTNDNWVIDRRILQSFDSNDNLISKLEQDFVNSTYKDTYLEEWKYIYNGMPDTLFKTTFYEVENHRELTTFIYDSQNNLIQKSEHYIDSLNIWQPYLIYSSTYDSYNNLVERKSEYFSNNIYYPTSQLYVEIVNDFKDYYGNSHFLICYRFQAGYFYFDTIANMMESLRLYPNPVRNSLNIEIGAIEVDYNVRVYSSVGTLCIEKKLFGSNKLDVSSLKSGVYLLEVQKGDIKKVLRFIK